MNVWTPIWGPWYIPKEPIQPFRKVRWASFISEISAARETYASRLIFPSTLLNGKSSRTIGYSAFSPKVFNSWTVLMNEHKSEDWNRPVCPTNEIKTEPITVTPSLYCCLIRLAMGSCFFGLGFAMPNTIADHNQWNGIASLGSRVPKSWFMLGSDLMSKKFKVGLQKIACCKWRRRLPKNVVPVSGG